MSLPKQTAKFADIAGANIRSYRSRVWLVAVAAQRRGPGKQ